MGRAADRATAQGRHFEGKVAIVTGAASGIGRALATELVDRGATVVVSDIDGDGSASIAEQLSRRAGDSRAIAANLDVTDAAAVDELVGRTAADHGGLDLLFNNAGIGVGGEVRELSTAHWRRVLDVNVWSVINGVNAAYPLMIAQGRGHIVNTASLSGLLPSPMLVPYSTTKHAVVGLSVGLRMEAAAHQVKVTVVCPGVIETPLLDKPNPEDLPPVASMPNIRSMLTSLVGPPYPVASLCWTGWPATGRSSSPPSTPVGPGRSTGSPPGCSSTWGPSASEVRSVRVAEFDREHRPLTHR